MNAPQTPREWIAAGKKAYAAGDYAAAAEAYAGAAEALREGGQDLDAAEMENNRAVSLLQINRAEGAREAVRGTAEIFAAAGDLKRQAIALANTAAAEEGLGEKERALELYRRSADLLAELGEDQLRAEVMKSISSLQLRDRDALGALFSMRRGLAEVENPTLVQRLLKRLLELPAKFLPR
ncbi:MAG: hypothetical protein U5K99_02295 [Anaerolineales bacterium]|nr:hypothetical protein [Anaerolineales bacterium]